MLRFMAPYLVVLLAFAVLDSVLYDAGVINATAFYGIELVGGAVALYGYERWEDRRQSR